MSKIGDLFILETTCGDAIIQYVGNDGTFGQLVRVFKKNAEDAFCEEEMFAIFFPVNAAVKKGLIRKFGKAEIPLKYTSLVPTKYPVSLMPTEKPSSWVVNDELGKRRVAALSDREKGYVLAYAVNVEEIAMLFCKEWSVDQEYPFN